MARGGKLTVAGVKAIKQAGRYGDGGALYLLVSQSGSKSWIARTTHGGKQRDIGLGGADTVTLAQAREKCLQVRIQTKAGLDPLLERNRSRGIPTFRQGVAKYIAENSGTWRNAKHSAQWLSTLEAYAFPHFGDVTLDLITVPKVRGALLEIWNEKPETARRVRQRIGAVLDWGFTNEFIPARVLLPSAGKGLPRQPKQDKHHEALPYAEIGAFVARLRERESMGRLALEAAILTACRSGEVRGATWGEVNLEAGLWSIPVARMKAGRGHVVPLSPAAKKVFARALEFKIAGSDLVFSGQSRGKPLSDMTLLKVCRDMAVKATPHGFRSSFRDWVAETTNFPRELAEKALAHELANKVEAAYQRGDLLEKRRELMNAWAAYCDGDAASVVRLVA